MADIPRAEGIKGVRGGTLYPPQKGYSGNPKGKPKGTKNRSTIARLWLSTEQQYTNPINGETETLSQEDIVTLSQIKLAREGDTSAYKALLDSAYGAPKQEIEQTNITPPEINITVVDTGVPIANRETDVDANDTPV